jgi:hypothetical protein
MIDGADSSAPADRRVTPGRLPVVDGQAEVVQLSL